MAKPITKNIQNAYSAGSTFAFNCWGTTLYIQGVLDEPYWVYGKDMSDWLKSNTYYVPENEVKRGDILVMRDREDTSDQTSLVHTAVYLGDGVYFHKSGSAPAEYTSKHGVIDSYYHTHHTHRRMKKQVSKVRDSQGFQRNSWFV